jgi:hypothetical protein
MAHRNKSFDAVKTMRTIRDDLSRRFKGMTFEEQKRAMRAAQKPKPARSGTRTAAKRTA